MSGVRGRGINYDTGAWPAGHPTRECFEPAAVREELRIIAEELHCNAVRVTGGDPDRLALAAGYAAELGLEVWFAPFPCERTGEQLLELFAECADRAERLRRGGAEVVLVTGAELSIFNPGFLPGADLFERMALFTERGPALRAVLREVPERLNPLLAEAAAAARKSFGGRLSYAALPVERVDWTPFDYVGVDAYRAAHNAATYRDEIRGLRTHGLPVAITEFGCCAFRGAAALGARGWLVVDRDADPRRLDGEYVRDEQEQARYLRELLDVFAEEGVDSAFWFTYAGYQFPRHPDPRYDLDLASYGLVEVTDPAAVAAVPKAAFHALAEVYGG